MKKIFRIIWAEIRMQHQHEFHSWFVVLSLLIWPVLGFLEVYYSYFPFMQEEQTGLAGAGRELLAFLATGYMCYTCFWSMVQNAWSMAWSERKTVHWKSGI